MRACRCQAHEGLRVTGVDVGRCGADEISRADADPMGTGRRTTLMRLELRAITLRNERE